ncbi:hypothetical protein LWF01_02375 [Saxibacter everestensis]|uniref:ESX secretion-associated protein EspG n=1 Tax=Saxibacter everestensis TaxID=2909229 RepID=A0ABY8QWU7_9MICO|nr:hypothetical protein LWF01_02375 [Brevibacteriaceae bacterium ZFBP1038]
MAEQIDDSDLTIPGVNQFRARTETKIAVLEVLRTGRAGRYPVVQLTDEELYALEGDRDPIAGMPYLSTLKGEQREFAREIASRSMASRDLIRISDVDEQGMPTFALPAEVQGVLAARSAASSVIIAERQASEAGVVRVLFIQADQEVVVEEEVLPAGVHVFSVKPFDAAAEDLQEFLDPDAVASVSGKPREVDLVAVTRGEATYGPIENEARWASVLTLVTANDASGQTSPVDGDATVQERRLTVYCAQDRVEVAEPHPDSAVVDIRAFSEDELRELVLELVTGGA